ncbi:MAG: flagellar hook-basal body complex protein FliE [Planctomycetaceae bacterium]|jgi:flagellar hook-basal body complex protein FliE|nr:flagellar hook-basal body complex protein FliE [Planctomycetaceae bacterium]
MTGLQGVSNLGNGNLGIGGLKPRTGNPIDFSNEPLAPGEQKNASFRDLLLGSIQEVNTMQQNADVAVETMLTGGDIGTAEVLTAIQKADVAFKLMMQVRNKLVAAFQEIQNIRV